MFRRILIESCLWIYKIIQSSGILEIRAIQQLYTRAYFVYKRWIEDSLANLFSAHPKLAEGGHIIDVGANIGYTAQLLARYLDPTCNYQVHAFEPDPKNFSELQRTIQYFDVASSVRAIQSAVGSSEGEVSLWLNQEHPADHRVLTDDLASNLRGQTSSDGKLASIRVPLVSLDQYCAKNEIKKISLVKIDVQGFELEVVRGMRLIIKDNPDLKVVFELSPAHLKHSGFEPKSLLEFFWNEGFQIHRITRDGSAEKLTQETAIRLCEHNLTTAHVDLLATRTELPPLRVP